MNNDAPTPRNTIVAEKPKSPRRELTPEFEKQVKAAWSDKEHKKEMKSPIKAARKIKCQG